MSATTPAMSISFKRFNDSLQRPALAQALIAELKLIVSLETPLFCMSKSKSIASLQSFVFEQTLITLLYRNVSTVIFLESMFSMTLRALVGSLASLKILTQHMASLICKMPF